MVVDVEVVHACKCEDFEFEMMLVGRTDWYWETDRQGMDPVGLDLKLCHVSEA